MPPGRGVPKEGKKPFVPMSSLSNGSMLITETELPAHIVTAFTDMMSLMFRHIWVLAERNVVLRRTRDLLLPRLVSGALDVAGLEIVVGD